MNDTQAIEAILDLARWAPSGDNTQPWRLEIVDSVHAVVHGFDTREHCVYDLDGWPSQLSIGALIETAAIAASAQGWRMRAVRRTALPETQPTYDLHFEPDAAVTPDPLAEFITLRTVQRRPYTTQPLSSEHKARLEAALGPEYSLRWLDGGRQRWRMALLLFRSARLRLTTPEAYRVHRDVIEWDARYSVDRVPDQALGVGRPMLAMMRFAMQSWERVQFFNRFMAGTWLPRLQMDFLPALGCGAHFALLARKPAVSIEENIEAGRAMQRFWLTATRLGLVMQPEMTPLIFARYANEGRVFSKVGGAQETARRVAQGLDDVVGSDTAAHGFFIGRIGHASSPSARSVRKELAALRQTGASAG